MGTNFVSAEITPAAILKELKVFIDNLEADKDHLQGGAVAILYKGQVIYKTTFGYQKGKENPITFKTLFPLASVSKPTAATVIALMINEGTLSLSEEWRIPGMKTKVNLKHILGHTTGYRFSGNSQIEQGMSRQQLLEELKNQNQGCNPGECYFYSNTIFSLVEEMLNTKQLSFAVGVEKLRDLLKTEEIQILPLKSGMKIAYPHVKNKNTTGLKALPFPPYYPKTVPAAAGVFASLDGMIELFKLQFGYRPDLISNNTLNQFHCPYISTNDIGKWGMDWPCPRDTIESYYGLGFRILRAKQYPGRDLIFHSGYISGAVSFVGFIPSQDIGMIILVNQGSPFALQKGINFWGEFLK